MEPKLIDYIPYHQIKLEILNHNMFAVHQDIDKAFN